MKRGSLYGKSTKDYFLERGEEKIYVPGKGTEERKSLIKLLDQLNKLKKLSTFDVAELKKALKEKRWNSDILDKIKKFIEIKNIKSVHILKNKEI